MKLLDLLKRDPDWIYPRDGAEDIVLSTRVRLARNVALFPFPGRATDAERKDVFRLIKEVLKETKIFDNGLILSAEDLTLLDKELLFERRLVSKEFLRIKKFSGVAISADETISIMINEEDHLRIQVISGGFELHRAFDIANKIDDKIGERVKYAFSKRWGYLTSCLTNVGTGLRASVLLHLPALNQTGKLHSLMDKLRKEGFAVRGFFGEGTKAYGNFLQVSNQITLGVSEEEIIRNLYQKVKEIVEKEKNARSRLYDEAGLELENTVWRAYGIMKFARLLNLRDFVNYASAIRTGIGMQIIKNVDLLTINKLLIEAMPAHLMKKCGKTLEKDEEDYERAKLVRERI